MAGAVRAWPRLLLIGAGLLAASGEGQAGQPPAPAKATTAVATPSPEARVKKVCLTCHNDTLKTAGLSLVRFEAARAEDDAEVAEKVIRKLRAGLMPPPPTRRPDEAAVQALVATLESRIDQAAALRPNPGRRPFQRLSRAEYARAVRDLLGVDVDVSALLPPDTISHGFDNLSDEQPFSPTLMEGYLRAASRISRLALGDPHATAGSAIYKVPRTSSQMRHVEGAPAGTRGGISLVHIFPADGEYVFKMLLHMGPTGDLFGSATKGEQIEVSIDGERVALLEIKNTMKESDPGGTSLETPPAHVEAGPRRVSAAFIQMADGPVDDLIAPIEHTLADTNVGETFGITALPHLRDFTISGPHKASGVGDTPSRRRIFTCRPTSAAEETACASQILERLARRAYRGRMDDEDHAELMRFYRQGRRAGGFEAGIRLALQAMLASPRFVFRLEQAPETARSGESYRVSDIDLASRLSFFLWGTVPDAELATAASQGALRAPGALERQVRRMLADPRSEALATRFAAQWLRLQDVDKVRPDPLLYPHWDHTLSESLQRETELFFWSLVREDRRLLDLFDADFTFVDERLARHYGIPNVMGSAFRRVSLTGENRRGILGHGSILLLTSPADRTSPVMRGKWVMEVLLGNPPPPPLPDVPALDKTEAVRDGRLLSVRERMEEHRENPACLSCHRVIDPLGLALENFDVTGAWRVKDNGVAVDASGELYDGTRVQGPAGLRQALLKRSDVLIRNFVENLLTYALGRRVEYYDMPAVRKISREAARNDNRMSSFILGVAKSAPFQMSRADEGRATEAAARARRPRGVTVSRR
jgi:cytochrome c551/c552